MVPGNGWILPALIMAPNVLFLFFLPVDAPIKENPDKFGRFMIILERTGQAGVVIIPFFYNFQFQPGTILEKTGLAAAVLSLIFYYSGWLRYFLLGRHFRLLFEPMLIIPLPMAVSPVICFISGSIVLSSFPLFIAAVILAAGHLYNSAVTLSSIRN